MASYLEYMQSEQWQRKRQEALEFWNFRCALCWSDQLVEVHHRTYERLGCEQLSDLIVLCDTCHTWHHRRVVRAKPEPIQAVLSRLEKQYTAKHYTRTKEETWAREG